jgi:hypothetical protein
MMVKPREGLNFGVGGNSSSSRRLGQENRKMKLVCFGIEANRNVTTDDTQSNDGFDAESAWNSNGCNRSSPPAKVDHLQLEVNVH